jgi:hypothetical protein
MIWCEVKNFALKRKRLFGSFMNMFIANFLTGSAITHASFIGKKLLFDGKTTFNLTNKISLAIFVLRLQKRSAEIIYVRNC